MTSLLTQVAAAAPFVAAWSVATIAVTALLTAVAALLHRVARGSLPNRLVWSVALCTAFAFTATQPWRRVSVASAITLPASVSSTVETPTSTTPGWRTAMRAVGGVVRAGDDALTRVSLRTAGIVRATPVGVRVSLVLLWPATTVVLLLIGVWSFRRQRRVVRSAAPVQSHGHTVFVTPGAGPAVYGVLRPRIIVPAWLMQRTPDEQRLVMAHEQSHIDARDPALLLTACVLTALTPLNPCAWYLLNRLRLAIELDCDARVLQAGVTPRHYGALLIDLSAAAAPAPLLTGATAFSHHASHLERRLRRMTDRPTTHTAARRLASLSIAALAMAAACGAELPTSAELEGMDVASAQQRTAALAPTLVTTRFVVDGKEVSEAEAKALGAGRIASINIRKLDKKTGEVLIATRAPGDSSVRIVNGTLKQGVMIAVRGSGNADSSRTLVINGGPSLSGAKSTFEGLIFIDGVKASEEAMKMPPDRIQSIEVIKGAAAEKLYGPEGAKGVIRITTKTPN